MSQDATKTTEYEIRPPVVTVMGHVDHGKTSILDAIRKTNVTDKEYGGITQHIGAYQISYKNKKITFIDTPGHQAFTQMRARGGKASDLVVLVVSAEEGVKPQTKEAISHAKAAGVPMIVAINKIDLANANPQKVKQELASENVLVEDWGGDVVSVGVSAKTGEGLDKLLDSILVVSEVLNLKADSKGELEAVIIESKLDRKKGIVVSCIVKNGTLRTGDAVTASGITTKVRALMNDRGEVVKESVPGDPVEILGFSTAPNTGDSVMYKGSDLAALSIVENRVEIIGKNAKKTVGMVLKSDTQGTLEAVKASLANLITSSVQATYAIQFLHTGTGDITESDVSLAKSTGGIVVGFDVRVPANVEDYAKDHGVFVKTYKTIYELIEDAEALLEGTASKEENKIKGRAQVLKLFKLTSGDLVAGCKVIAGALKENSHVSIYDKNPADVTQEDTPLYTGDIKKLKKGQNDIDIVGRDNECGVFLKPQFDLIKPGMWIEVR